MSKALLPSPADFPTLCFIGGGNMARSLIGGLRQQGLAAERIRVAEPFEASRDGLQRDFGVPVFIDNTEAVQGASVWLLATKPQVLREVCESLASQAQAQRPLVISIAAGISSAQIARWLGDGIAVVRSMPNTPALLGAGATGLFANTQVDAAQRALSEAMLACTGITRWIADESLMDAVTALSGSGPAYIFLLAEAMQAAGETEGLPADTARDLALQTIFGAARMLTESGEPADVLRQRVTSPKGTTQAALDSFEADGFRAMVARAIQAARVRGAELSEAND